MSERRSNFTRKIRRLRRYFFVVPWCVPSLGISELRATVAAIVTARTIKGPSVAGLDAAMREMLGKRFALPVNRGRTAIELALRAVGVSNGDDVVIPAYVCSTAINPILNIRANPVFADVDETLNVTPRTIESALTTRTKAVIVPHLFGKAAAIEEIESDLNSRGIALIDDAAQSLGATCNGRLVGSFGSAGIVSSGPGKALSGPAGAVLVTDSVELYERACAESIGCERTGVVLSRLAGYWLFRRLRRITVPLEALLWRFGPRESVHVNAPAANVDAAVALCQLRRLRDNAERRCRDTAAVAAVCERLGLPCLRNYDDASVALKVIVMLPEDTMTANEAVEIMADAGIECQPGYIPGDQAARAKPASTLPSTGRLWERVLCLPTDTARLLASDPERVVNALTRVSEASTDAQR